MVLDPQQLIVYNHNNILLTVIKAKLNKIDAITNFI